MSPARVQVVVEAKDATSGVFRALTSQMGAFGGVVEELTAKNVNWGNVAAMATQMVVNGVRDAINVTTQYAQEVRDLSLASGQSAEESSRMLQVLDDYQLTAEDAALATRALTKEGLAPTIETVAQLSGQYLQLNDAQAKNEFLMKKLGRAGKEWMNLLSQGPDAIMAMNDAVSEGLILTEENIRASEDYRLALDQWNDGVMALKVSIGTELLPVLADMMTGLNNSNEIRAEANRLMMEGVAHNREEALAMAEANIKTQEATIAKTDLAEATKTAAQAELELAEAAKAADAENKTFISTLSSVDSALDTYTEGISASYAAYKNGEQTIDEHKAKVQELAAAYEETKNKIVLSIVEMKLATDGWTDAEMNAYLQVGKKLGVFTEQTVRETQTIVAEADKLVASYGNMIEPIHHVGERALDTAEDFGVMTGSAYELSEAGYEAAGGVGATKSQLNGLPPSGSLWRYKFIIDVEGRVPKLPNQASNIGSGQSDAFDYHNQQGGEVFAGVPTWVGEAGTERFVPAQNGRILGHAESLRAAMLGGGGSGTNYFYGPVTLQISQDGADGIMGLR